MSAATPALDYGTGLVVEHPGREGLRAAFALIRLTHPDVDLRSWLRFAAPRRKRHGVVTVRHRAQPYPCGVCCFSRDRDLRLGEVLTAQHLVALDLLDPAPLLSALLDELESLAARLGCAAMRVAWAPGAGDQPWPGLGRVVVLGSPRSPRPSAAPR